MYSLVLQRVVGKRTNDEKIRNQIDKIVDRGLGGSRGRTWKASSKELLSPRKDGNGMWVFTYQLDFEKIKGQLAGEAEYKQWEEIKAMVEQTGQNAAFGGQNWVIQTLAFSDRSNKEQIDVPLQGISTDVTPIEPEGFGGILGELNSRIERIITGVKEVQPFGNAKTWDQLTIPPELLGPNSDEHLAQHYAWQDLYGVNPQIRILLSNINRAQQTNGESRNHAVLFGHAGCGKTTTMFALEKMFGSDSVLKLDATSTTKAGLEKLFFNDLKEIPPLVFMEEAEKADPEALKIWLGALDDRGEIRKINFRVNQLRAVKVLFICSVNNKNVFDRMMGSDGSEAGALSSRCVTQVYYPRPSENILYQILDKEIREKGGSHDWIVPAIEIAKALNVTDPRIVRSYLAGGDRLLDGTYKRDWLAVATAQKAFNQ